MIEGGPTMEDRGGDGRVAISIRLPVEVHRAASVAAARTGKSLNTWMADLAGAASGAANAAALLAQVRDMQLSDSRVWNELIGYCSGLIKGALDHTGAQLSEIQEALAKITGEIESKQIADEIRNSKE